MPSIEQSGRIGGAVFLGVPIFDFFVWTLDNYARVELVVKLHGLLPPILTSPATIIVCVILGLTLLYVSALRQLQRVAQSAVKSSRLVDTYNTEIYTVEKPKFLMPVLVVLVVVLIATPLIAVGYSLAYKGKPPGPFHQPPPYIAYLKAPKTRRQAVFSENKPTINQHSSAPNSPNVIGDNNQFSYAADPPNRLLGADQAAVLVNALKLVPSPFWIITETSDYDKGSEQMLFSAQLVNLLAEAQWTHLTYNHINLPVYRNTSERGITIAYEASLSASAQALSRELTRNLVRNSLRTFNDTQITRVNFKGDFIVIVVGIQ